MCLSTLAGGGGTPSSQWGGGYPIELTRGGGITSQVWAAGYPIPGLDGEGGYPIPGAGEGYPMQLMGVPHPRSGWRRYPIPGPGGGGVPYPADQGGTPSQVWAGGTPSQVQVGVPHPPVRRQSSIASTCYVADGMPLAFTQEDFLVFVSFAE